ncbi:MAG TPA: aminotransferase class IV [Candidatus Udaeobacter sp.]|jgi:branched-chain amino acid aminotransferase|nr:aminotransferase class IV [Candidatus Udaeobacter sp.]
MIKLQEPKYVHMGGELRLWKDATIHVGCEAAIRGLNVYEGLKGYWQPDGGPFAVIQLRQHYDRLSRSARILYLPFDFSFDYFKNAIVELAEALLQPDRDMWFRTTLFALQGHWGEGTETDLVVTAYQHDQKLPEPIDIGVSIWRRGSDLSLPPRIKTGTNYQPARLARIEGRARGCQDMVLLNEQGRVAEATGAAILMVRDGKLSTTPATEGALESVTIDIIEALAHDMNIPFERRPIDRTELLVADEFALCGTIGEVIPVKSIDGFALPKDAPIIRALQTRYLKAIRGIEPHPSVERTVISRQASGERRKSSNAIPELATK